MDTGGRNGNGRWWNSGLPTIPVDHVMIPLVRKQQFTVDTSSSITCSYSVLGIGTLAYSIVMIGVCLALYHSSFSIVSAVYQSFTSGSRVIFLSNLR
jgi:hypothetical protein